MMETAIQAISFGLGHHPGSGRGSRNPGTALPTAKKFASVLALNVRGVADKLLSGWAVSLTATNGPRIAEKFTWNFAASSSTCQPVQFVWVAIRFSPVFWSICLAIEFPRCPDGSIMPWGSAREMPAALTSTRIRHQGTVDGDRTGRQCFDPALGPSYGVSRLTQRRSKRIHGKVVDHRFYHPGQ
jgi:hypothetical protein